MTLRRALRPRQRRERRGKGPAEEAPVARGVVQLLGPAPARGGGEPARGDLAVEADLAEAEHVMGTGEGGDAGFDELTGDVHGR